MILTAESVAAVLGKSRALFSDAVLLLFNAVRLGAIGTTIHTNRLAMMPLI